MRAKDLYADFEWTAEFKGQCVIYAMRYQDKDYVGSTANLPSKIYSARRCLAPLGVTKCAIRVLEVVDLIDRYTREAFHIKRLRTLVPRGHNKTSSGKGGIQNVLEEQGDGHPSIFKSTTWASPVAGKCFLYVLEYDSKRYVGTTLELRRRIGSHRRTLVRRGITEGYVVHCEEIPVAERSKRESAAIEAWNTYAPAGYNKTKNGTGGDAALIKKLWAENPVYRAKQIKSLNTPERKEAQRLIAPKRAIAMWQNPEIRARLSASRKAMWEDPAFRLNQTLKLKAMWEDPAYRLKQTLERKARWEDPAFRLNQSLKMKAAYARKRAKKLP